MACSVFNPLKVEAQPVWRVRMARASRRPDVTGMVVFVCLAVSGQQLDRNWETCLIVINYEILLAV
jgi:hypothetical protein